MIYHLSILSVVVFKNNKQMNKAQLIEDLIAEDNTVTIKDYLELLKDIKEIESTTQYGIQDRADIYYVRQSLQCRGEAHYKTASVGHV